MIALGYPWILIFHGCDAVYTTYRKTAIYIPTKTTKRRNEKKGGLIRFVSFRFVRFVRFGFGLFVFGTERVFAKKKKAVFAIITTVITRFSGS